MGLFALVLDATPRTRSLSKHKAVRGLCKTLCTAPGEPGTTWAEKTKAARRRLSQRAEARGSDQAVSPYTVTVMSTRTSVWSATLTVLSPTTLIWPLGMRTCDFTTL